jgi:hypothetical protein
MRDVRGIAPVGNVSRERVCDFAPALGKRQQQHACVEDNRPPSKAAVIFLRETVGRVKVSWLSSVMAGVAVWRGAHRGGRLHSLRGLNALRHTRYFKPDPAE